MTYCLLSTIKHQWSLGTEMIYFDLLLVAYHCHEPPVNSSCFTVCVWAKWVSDEAIWIVLFSFNCYPINRVPHVFGCIVSFAIGLWGYIGKQTRTHVVVINIIIITMPLLAAPLNEFNIEIIIYVPYASARNLLFYHLYVCICNNVFFLFYVHRFLNSLFGQRNKKKS